MYDLTTIEPLINLAPPTTVERMATALDRIAPGWAHRIDPHDLDLRSCHRCILGQVFGAAGQGWAMHGYEYGTRVLEAAGVQLSETETYASVFADNHFLPAWKDAIEARTGRPTRR